MGFTGTLARAWTRWSSPRPSRRAVRTVAMAGRTMRTDAIAGHGVRADAMAGRTMRTVAIARHDVRTDAIAGRTMRTVAMAGRTVRTDAIAGRVRVGSIMQAGVCIRGMIIHYHRGRVLYSFMVRSR